MPRTPLFARLLDTLHAANTPGSASEAVDRARHEALSRRQALKAGAVAAGALAGASLMGCAMPVESSEAPRQTRQLVKGVGADIGVVGGGIAGLSCAYELRRAGCAATIHDANTRTGGRIWSMGGAFAGPVDFGQVIERGGELIDTPHKTMIGYAQEFGLTLEDITKPVRDTFYYFDGQLVPESTMVDQYRVLVDAMKDDLRMSSAGPTADVYTPYDRYLDDMSLDQYLDLRGAAPQIKKLLRVAYNIEYGVETDKLSCLSFLLFAKASKQSKIRLWGNFSDERYHVVGGNQQIVDALASRLAGQINLGRRLVAVRKTPAGRIELTFKEGSTTVVATHDAVVLALPFNLMRDVQFDASLEIPDWKTYAFQNTVYGTNAKLMVGFQGRPWIDYGSSGAAYSDQAKLQNTWETSPTTATDAHAVLTDYTGGNLGASLSPQHVQSDTEAFLTALDKIYPGAKARARRTSKGDYVAHLQHWPSNPLTKGSYTANAPGYFTRIAGNEGKSVGALYFAGETTDSFYSWQGYMEGGALSGVRAAGDIVRALGGK